MPEIWLPYGKDEIVINIKAEYLGSVVESTEKQLDAEQLVIDDVDYADVVIHDGSMVKVPSFLLKSKVLVISPCSFDPLFGFYGPHILLTSYAGLLREAVKRWDRKLNPGGDPDTGWFAMRLAKSIPDLKVMTFLKGPRGILEFRYGEVESAFSYMKDYLKSRRSVEVQQSRFIIIGAGGDSADRTLAGSLLSASNNIEVAAEDAEIILVA